MHTKKREISADIFRAYDIRGIYNDDLYPETMLKIGLGLGTYAKERSETSVVVGNDIRTTSHLLANALISGLLSSGVDVTNVGTTSFGVCAFSGWLLKQDIIAYVYFTPPRIELFQTSETVASVSKESSSCLWVVSV